jgi:dienelactone hydrolase
VKSTKAIKSPPKHLAVSIPVGDVTLDGDLDLPPDTRGLVVFAHGSGGSRLSPRNQFVASAIQDAGLGTLLFDLLTVREEHQEAASGEFRFDIVLLARRLTSVTAWIENNHHTQGMSIGYFGASTGAAAALVSAAEIDGRISAIVSRGGRPDLAGDALPKVTAPTLLIVGGHDNMVLCLNDDAMAQLRCKRDLRIVPRATHLFEEPGALHEVAQLSCNWFKKHLTSIA